MSAPTHRKLRHPLWRRLRIYFRRFRMTVWFVLFVVVAIGLFLNTVGLPQFVQQPLLSSLRARGLNLEMTHLRVSWHRGLVANQLRLQGTTNAALPSFAARSADLRLNLSALLHRRLEVSGIELRQGNLTWDLSTPEQPDQRLAITNINATLRFLPGDEWSLDRFEAGLREARFTVNGSLTNATALRDWPIFRGGTKQPPQAFLTQLRRVHTALDATKFTGRPEVRLTLSGDAKDLRSFTAFFHVTAPGADTPWGEFGESRLRIKLTATTPTAPLAAELHLESAAALTPWAKLRDLELIAITTATDQPEIMDCRATLKASHIVTRWANASALQTEAQWSHALSNLLPQNSTINLTALEVTSPWANCDSLALTTKSRPATQPPATNASLAWWNALLPHALELDAVLTNASITNFALPRLAFTVRWDAPEFSVTNLTLQLPDGQLTAAADLDVVSRELHFAGEAGFDIHRVGQLLTEKSRAWIEQFQWTAPPGLQMSGALRLPAWTNRQPDWRTEVKPTIRLAGAVAITNGSYRGVTADRATTRLAYTNHLWQLPDLALTRPEGTLHVALQSHELTHDYQIRLRGPLHPSALASQLDEKGRRGLGYFESTNAPHFDAEVSGRWYERDRLTARARVTWTNFSFRAQHADRVEAALTYSNQILAVFNPRIERGDERLTADSIHFDFARQLAWLTNGFTDTDPMAIAIAIGPKVAEAVRPYHFVKPPTARVNGIIPLRGESEANLHFDLAGGPFHWTLFKLPQVAGHVCWANESVILSNFVAEFYGGAAWGEARFDVSQRGHTPYQFDLTVTNTDLHALMSDLHSPTNQLEGTLAGRLTVTAANVEDWQSWQGFGHAQLRDGLIWDSPIFGVMSSVMNTVVPGIGNSRAHDAGGTFIITNSVIFTRDLEIRASGMRLQYEGTVDFEKRVNARVQAELLRDTWILGKAMSTVLWPVSKLFEYKVTGTLAAPNPQPVYLIPKIFLAPLSPVRSLRNMFQPEPVEAAPAPTPPAPAD